MKNHLGDNAYTTFSGWKAAVKKAYPNATFHGDKDIGGAWIGHTVDIGDWDGAEGSVYAADKAIRVLANVLNTHTGLKKDDRYSISITLSGLLAGKGAMGVDRAHDQVTAEEDES